MTDLDKRIDEIMELKPCPFCGFEPKAGHITAGYFWALHLHHQSKIKCPLEGFVIESEEGFKQWNTRPVERELQAELAAREWQPIENVEHSDTYLVWEKWYFVDGDFTDDGYCEIRSYDSKKKQWSFLDENGYVIACPKRSYAHFMPLPTPPSEAK